MDVFPLEQLVQDRDVAVGAKAVNLARMAAMGLPVPPGFAVAGDAYAAHLAGLGRELDAVVEANPTDVGDALQDLRAAIENVELETSLRQRLRSAWADLEEQTGDPPRVAVRSSGTAEDLPGHSFAGQHDTFLDVEGLQGCEEALKRCWASLWTERAYQYRERNDVDHHAVQMAVVVQQMVPADVSGVLFTVDPVTGDRDRMVIEACAGLGEVLVSGRVTPERVVFARTALEIEDRDLAPDHPDEILLGDWEVGRLARLALQVEEAFGGPQDLEFSLVGSDVFLLQARPITTLTNVEESAEDRTVWSNVNSGEVLPDVVTPLSWSVLEPVIGVLIGSFFEMLGMDLRGHTIFGRVGGRVYANLNTVLAAIRRVPGMRNRGLTEVFGGQHDDALGEMEFAPEDLPDLGFSYLRMARRMPALLWRMLTLSRDRADAALQRVRERAVALLQTDLADLDDPQLIERATGAVHALLGDSETFELTGLAQLHEQSLYDSCARWFGDDGNILASRMMAGLGNNDNANAGLALWALAARARGSQAILDELVGAADFDGLRDHAGATQEGRRFLDAWQSFMSEHGHHARGELELYNARWSEQPDEILAQVRSYAEAGDDHDFQAQFDALARDRAVAEAEALGRLRNPLKRWMLAFMLRKARQVGPMRETLKSHMVRTLAGVRRVVLELGRRLSDRKDLYESDDVFFVTLDELPRLLEEPEVLRPLIDQRRLEYLGWLDVHPPAVVRGRFDPDEHRAVPAADGMTVFTGLAVSPGVVTGRARVILRAGTDRLEPGEILVAPFTDPGWTPYFINAAAIVMDLGGLLSHGSIVAREFGIPAVVNVGPATEVIETGQMLRVDGGKGSVEILEE